MKRKSIDWVSDEIWRARTKARPVDPAVGKFILKVRSWMEEQRWDEYGLTDYFVLLSHLQIAFTTGKLKYRATVRELAELAQVSKNAVSLSNSRLVDRGVLVKVRPGDNKGESTIWALRLPYINHILPNPICSSKDINNSGIDLLNTIYPMCLNVPFQVISHDVWRRKGLGKAALRVWMKLHESENWTINELAASMAYSIRVCEINPWRKADCKKSHVESHKRGRRDLWGSRGYSSAALSPI